MRCLPLFLLLFFLALTAAALQAPATKRRLPATMESGEFETFNTLAKASQCGGATCRRAEARRGAPDVPPETCCHETHGDWEYGACFPPDVRCCGCSATQCCACPGRRSSCSASCDPDAGCHTCCGSWIPQPTWSLSLFSSSNPKILVLLALAVLALACFLYRRATAVVRPPPGKRVDV